MRFRLRCGFCELRVDIRLTGTYDSGVGHYGRDTMVIQPINAGWEFSRWLNNERQAIDAAGGRFYAAADIHRAYDDGGIFAAVDRCTEGIRAALTLLDRTMRPGTEAHEQLCKLLAGWTLMATDLLLLLEGTL